MNSTCIGKDNKKAKSVQSVKIQIWTITPSLREKKKLLSVFE